MTQRIGDPLSLVPQILSNDGLEQHQAEYSQVACTEFVLGGLQEKHYY